MECIFILHHDLTVRVRVNFDGRLRLDLNITTVLGNFSLGILRSLELLLGAGSGFRLGLGDAGPWSAWSPRGGLHADGGVVIGRFSEKSLGQFPRTAELPRDYAVTRALAI